MLVRHGIGVVFAVAVWLAPAACRSADRDALWKIVHDRCVPDQERSGDPSPCARVDLKDGVEKGYAVLKDRVGATQFLLIPTRQVSGIESPLILEPNAPNYWSAAWQARTYVFDRAKKQLPRQAIGLAVNSAVARSQDQLHIHIDCVLPEIRDELARHAGDIGKIWSPLGFALAGHRYVAMRIEDGDMPSDDPFRLLASGDASARRDMGAETLVLVGATFGEGRAGFILLAARADPAAGDLAHGEDLLDHTCAVAAAGPQ